MRSLVTFLIAVLFAGCTLPFAEAPTPTATLTPSPRPTRTPRPVQVVTPFPALTPPPMMPSFYGFDPERALAAPLLEVNSAQTVQFDQTGIAWFRINLQTGQAYELFTANLSDGLDTTLVIFNRAGDEVAFDDDFEGFASRIIYLPDESATFFVRLDSFLSVSSAGASCLLHLRTLALPPPDAFEPDDTQAQARPIALDEVQNRTFTHAKDIDWVRFEAQAGQIYLFRTLDLGVGVDTMLSLYNERGEELAYNDDAEDLASIIVYGSDTDATLYLKVSIYTIQQVDIPYRLAATTFTPAPPDAYEPDNELAAARPIAVSEMQNRTISDPRDSDWLALETRAGYAYRIMLRLEGRGADLALVLTDAAGNELESGVYLDDLSRDLIYSADIDATRFVAIRPSYFRSNDTRYSVQVEAVPLIARDAFEPDDLPANAGLLVEGETQLRTVQDSSDVDLVQVQVQAGKAYQFVATYDPYTVWLSLDLLDSEREVIVDADFVQTDNGRQIRYLANADAILYLQVTAYDVQLGGASYQLSMETIPSPQPDAYEPDNDLQSARPIEIGATQQHNFIGRNDEDWLKLDLQTGQTYIIETFDLASDVDTVIELFDAQGQSLAMNDDSDGFASRIEFRPPRSAIYYVRITNIGVAMFGATYQVRVSAR